MESAELIQLMTPYQLGLISRPRAEVLFLAATTRAINAILVARVDACRAKPTNDPHSIRFVITAQQIIEELTKRKNTGLEPALILPDFSAAAPCFNAISFDVQHQYESVGWTAGYYYLCDNKFLEHFSIGVVTRAM